MVTPSSQAAFLAWLDAEIAEAEVAAKKLRDNTRDEGYCDGQLDALKAVRTYFTG